MTDLGIDRREKTVRQNQYRVLQSFKRLSEVNLNEENEHLEETVLELRRELWELKQKITGGDPHPFTIQEDVEIIEGELHG
ncbi:MAG: hypothetical protein ABEJ03_04790 [Candidatus Nanohaloarchaea archaeon]